jgi:glycosyltransferase involved in cell wall biosynthesis
MLSIVIPVLNEVESLEPLHREIEAMAAANGLEIEVIFIDDGSRDGSWKAIEGIAAKDPRVRGLRFRRNFGKAAALTAGFDEALGEFIVTLDADLQDDPQEIPSFLAEIQKGLDVVSGWKKVRHDPWTKVLPSRVFNRLVGTMTGVNLHDHNCGMKCYRREVFDEVRIYGELHRFVPVLAAARGFRVGELVIQHRPRRFGRSKYGGKRFLKGFLDLLTVTFLTGYGQRPQHLLGTVGMVSLLLGSAGLAYLSGYWVVGQLNPELGLLPLHQRPAMFYSLGLVLFGGQMLSIGVLGELIVAYHSRAFRTFSIADRTDSTGSGPPAPLGIGEQMRARQQARRS